MSTTNLFECIGVAESFSTRGIAQLARTELAELVKDRERLSWLEANSINHTNCLAFWVHEGESLREAIDAAMKASGEKV